ncbi:arylamine N-acetyltransferase [Streptomyces sp. MST-110588]|uniref:arylamine N-acetyltransferase family protein n=1 Tax=Streptomyces sp. MST-110588 TaxID=2833628 RepID=UPI001F5C4A25|nr:arylamine N-acetyltransferase [Streptomyces sp. MST-110588]UNO40659.1 arylamine N-acetyltransferase [Streptomyces sp. MST-110588]
MTESVWGGERLDLDAYLARIGYEGDREPTPDTLRAVHAAHVAAIPFENLDVVLGRPIVLDLEALQEKLVGRRRGGYCYEQNLLYAAALERLGFRVTGLAARVRMGESKLRPVTHALLKVTFRDSRGGWGNGGGRDGGEGGDGGDGGDGADGGEWITDVGFGGEALLAPLPLREGVESRQGVWTFGLVREQGPGQGPWVLRSAREDGWLDVYAFGSEERFPVDYGVFNHYISTHPRSPFIRRAVVLRPGPEVRRSLIGTELTLSRPGHADEVRQVAPEELPAVLAGEFGVELDERDADALVKYNSQA